MKSTRALRERLRSLSAFELALPALATEPPAYLVGGAVRDLLRGEEPEDLDIAVEGDAPRVARAVAEQLGGEAIVHERFGTATLRLSGHALDLATTRREVYEQPGALPRVEAAPLEDDLARRDFSVNAMAIGLTGDDLGHLYDPQGGAADLDARLVRVLHPQSFHDDPTRLLRALRYEIRLGFTLEQDSERAALEASTAGALATVSGARIRDELMDLLAEPDVPSGIERMRVLAIDRGLHPALRADAELVASAALGAAAVGANRALSALAALCSGRPAELDEWLAWLQLEAGERRAVARAAAGAVELAFSLRAERTPSELRRLLLDEPRELLALALALGAPPEPLMRWVTELESVRLEISGADLLAAGVPEGPALGAALAGTLDRKLDGKLRGREQELESAVELARRREP